MDFYGENLRKIELKERKMVDGREGAGSASLSEEGEDEFDG